MNNLQLFSVKENHAIILKKATNYPCTSIYVCRNVCRKTIKIMATIHLVVLSSRQNSAGEFPVFIAVTENREVRYIKTDYAVDDLYQFDNGAIVCRKDAKVMNQRLKYVLSEYQEKLNEIPNQRIYNCSQIKEILEGKRKLEQLVTIKEYMETRISELRKEGRDSYADMNVYSLSKVLGILGDITLQSFSPATIDKFVRGMSSLSNATKQMRLTHLKACINEAIREGIVKYDIHPFVYTKMPKSAVKQLDITIEEFVKIQSLETKHKRIGLAKDLFLLSFYLGGMNLADVVQVDFSGDVIKYVRQKTSLNKEGDKVITFSVPEEAKAIIKKYIKRNGKLDFGYNFTYSNFQRYLNRCLKSLADEAGIETDFSYYSARKTFSQFAFDLGIKTELIEYCIGQSMKENRPIYNYIRVMQRQADAAIRRVIDYTNEPGKFELSVVAC